MIDRRTQLNYVLHLYTEFEMSEIPVLKYYNGKRIFDTS